MKKILISAITAFLAFTTPLFAADVTRELPVTDNWSLAGMAWDSGSKIMVRHRTYNADGILEICVSSSFLGNIPHALNREVLRRAKIIGADGETILKNLTFAKINSSRYFSSNIVGRPGKCVSTGLPYPRGGLHTEIEFYYGRYSVPR